MKDVAQKMSAAAVLIGALRVEKNYFQNSYFFFTLQVNI